MNDIYLILKIEFQKFRQRNIFWILFAGFILFTIGIGWIRYQSQSIAAVGEVTGFQLAAFVASLSSPLLNLLVIILASASLSSELVQGTLSLVLTRPIWRTYLILGKLLNIYMITLGLLLTLFILGLGIGYFFCGLSSLAEKEYIIYSGYQLIGHYSLGFLTSLLPFFAWGTIAFFFSSIIKNSTGALAVSLVLYFIFLLVLPFDEIPSVSPNHFINFSFEMTGKIMRGLPAEWTPAVFTYSIYSLVYLFLFAFLTVILFKRKDILS